MFYLKYRPQKFSDLIAPNPVADGLVNQVKGNNVSHAYLFVGPRGTGKTTTARILAKAVNCEDIQPNGDPCDKCSNCKAITKGNFPDLIEIDAASNRGIDDIRLLRDKIGLAPSQGRTKVYIIDEVHMLTAEAFNALLKTLEEPPEHAIFILCTTEASKVIDTIKSRCQIFSFRRASVEQIVSKLEFILKNEKSRNKKSLDREVLRKIAQASFGGYRDAETILQQVMQGDLDVDSMVGYSGYAEFLEFTDFLLMADPAGGLGLIGAKYNQGVDMQVWSYALLDYFKALLYIKSGVSDGLVDVTEDVADLMRVQAGRISTKDLVFLTRKFMEARNGIGESGISLLPLELAVAEVCSERGDNGNSGDVVDSGDSPDSSASPARDASRNSLKKDISLSNNNPAPKDAATPVEKISTDQTPADQAPIADQTSVDQSSAEQAVTLDQILHEWDRVLRESTKHNHSVRALLKSTKPIGVEGNSLILEAQFAFHKDRLEFAKNREIVETVLLEIFSVPLTITCCLNATKQVARKKARETGNLTDLNVVAPEVSEMAQAALDSSLLEVFDGGLPL